jgi:hypothetical protein
LRVSLASEERIIEAYGSDSFVPALPWHHHPPSVRLIYILWLAVPCHERAVCVSPILERPALRDIRRAEYPERVESGQSLKAERTAAFRPHTLQTCHSASGQTVPKDERPLVAVVARKRTDRNPPKRSFRTLVLHMIDFMETT